MRLLGIVGWSGSGKTMLITRLVPELTQRGVSVSTIKHTHHDTDIDVPGKDSYEHRKAGATESVLTTPNRWALVRELRGEPEPSLKSLLERMTPVDLVLIEGVTEGKHPKLEVSRSVMEKPLRCKDDLTVVAVASDRPLKKVSQPVFPLDDVAAIAEFIIERLLPAKSGKGRGNGKGKVGKTE